MIIFVTVIDHSQDLLKEWHPTKNGNHTPFNISYGSSYEAFWICSSCGYEWRRRVSDRTSRKKAVVQNVSNDGTTRSLN
ncbi:zinc-ribbon domain-containing protein (plasmid) [Metabacillus halosaccharovorans]|uniref:zinc-ribbon domain-containing protein n=1 Tax=Metabacillus halosaccharovorans TaxID=930124 RepID=UPI001C1F267F|nr:hypothetical protein [Metabacillus halosaccharovorans]